jgi:GNAT superfamily N-acetyltransferase
MISERAEGEYVCRRAVPGDRPAILGLCRKSLGWSDHDPAEAFFIWKHDENAFGQSLFWVAETPDGMLVGLRAFLRWRFRDERGKVVSAVRAVDTATHPDWRGRGIFSRLTLGALPELADEGIDLVFNTPNDQSMPGYLKMGWSKVGRMRVGARLASGGSLLRLRTARTAADLWSEPTDVGDPASEGFTDSDGVDALLASARRPGRFTTERTPAFLDWRYCFEPLHYRVLHLGDSLADGVVVFRARRRGRALEAAICDVIAPPGARLGRALRYIARRVGADYLLASAASAGLAAGFVPAVGLGPVLTWMPINRSGIPAIEDLGLVLADIELF